MAMLIAGFAIVTYDLVTYKAQRLNEMSTQAEIFGAISSAALVFNDAKAAQEYLSALRARPQMISAVIYDSAGRIFAVYQKGDIGILNNPTVEPDGYRTE